MSKDQSRKVEKSADVVSLTPTGGKGPSTKELLIEAGERLFGERGIDGASLREITAEAGQSNSNVVQYHFGDKAGLIRSILTNRVARIEHVRSMQLAILDDREQPNPRTILKILWVPLMSIKDEAGGHPYCRFMLQYMLHPRLTRHPLMSVYSFPHGPDDGEMDLPAGKRVVQLLFAAYADLPKELILKRLSALATMFLASVVEHDNSQSVEENGKAGPYEMDVILDMAVAALGAPA